MKRGDIVLVKFDPVVGSEQGKTRPAIILQNNIGNKILNTTIVAPITSTIPKKYIPVCVVISPQESGLPKKSTILLNQIRTVDKNRILKPLGNLSEHKIERVNFATKISLGLV